MNTCKVCGKQSDQPFHTCMTPTPRTDAFYSPGRFRTDEESKDFARQIELENIKLLEVARAANDWCNKERFDEWEGQKLIETMRSKLKSLEESGVKI